jgi:hypothetical protein
MLMQSKVMTRTYQADVQTQVPYFRGGTSSIPVSWVASLQLLFSK